MPSVGQGLVLGVGSSHGTNMSFPGLPLESVKADEQKERAINLSMFP